MSRWVTYVAACQVLLTLGCDAYADRLATSPDHADAAVVTSTPDAGLQLDAAAPSQAADAGAQPHTSFERALPLKVEESVLQLIYTAGETTYFTFEASEGAFYVMSTENSPFSPDNTLAVYDSDQHVIAINDSGSIWPGDYVDARLVFRAPHAGRYFVRVQDETYTAEDLGERFSSPLSYHFMVRSLHDGMRGFAQQSADGAPKTVELVPDENGKNAYVTVFGSLARGESASFELTGKPNQALIGQLHPAGTHGDGSTAEALRVLARSQPEGHTLASIQQHEGFSAFHPPVGAGTYRVDIEQPEAAGDNGFYAVDLVLLEDNPSEQAERDNGQLKGAEAIQLTGSPRRRGRVLSRLPAGDVDYYRFEVGPSEQMFAVCEAQSGGSGVRGLRAQFLDDHEKALRDLRESESMNLVLDPVRAERPGTYYLKLTADTPSDGVEPWVRCAVIVSP